MLTAAARGSDGRRRPSRRGSARRPAASRTHVEIAARRERTLHVAGCLNECHAQRDAKGKVQETPELHLFRLGSLHCPGRGVPFATQWGRGSRLSSPPLAHWWWRRAARRRGNALAELAIEDAADEDEHHWLDEAKGGHDIHLAHDLLALVRRPVASRKDNLPKGDARGPTRSAGRAKRKPFGSEKSRLDNGDRSKRPLGQAAQPIQSSNRAARLPNGLE